MKIFAASKRSRLANNMDTKATSQGSLWRALCNRTMLICICIGFSSGLPLYVLVSLVPAWLKSESVDLSKIGLFALVGFPYTWKFLWSPVMDGFCFFKLGKRRCWMLLTQTLLIILISILGVFSPQKNLLLIALICFLVAFFSASQDVVIDAYRRELLKDTQLGLGNALHVNAYRLAGLIPGSLSLILADHMPWAFVFHITALFMVVGIATTMFIKEPSHAIQAHSFYAIFVAPFNEFWRRKGIREAFLILAFLFLYKLGDSMATALSTPFYLDMGFSKTAVGLVAKQAALWPMIIGGLAGGVVMLKLGINKSLWLFGFVQMLSIFGFYGLAISKSTSLTGLALVVGFEYLGVGLGTTAFIAFIARTTSKQYAATQMALFTALTAIPRTFINASTGFIVHYLGWGNFFLLCVLLAIPGILLLPKVAPWS